MDNGDRNAQATKGDLADLKKSLTEATKADIADLKQALTENLMEALRDTETKLLNAFCGFAKATTSGF